MVASRKIRAWYKDQLLLKIIDLINKENALMVKRYSHTNRALDFPHRESRLGPGASIEARTEF